MKYEPATPAEVVATKGIRPGAAALLQVLRDRVGDSPGRDPRVDGIFNKRPIRGSVKVWSTHAVSRGIDFGMKTDRGGKFLGDFILFVLMQRAEMMQIQQIIWNDGTSDVAYRPGQAPKRMKSQLHKNHLHIEITKHMADVPLVDAVKWYNAILDIKM